MIELAIFDMDGLMIDSEPFWRQSHIEVVAAHGGIITEDDVRSHAGKRTDEVAQTWIDQHGWEAVTNHDIADEVVTKVMRHIEASGIALPGLYKAIGMLKSHNVPIAVGSSSAPKIIDAVLRKLNVVDYIDLSHSAVHEVKGKPDPAVFLTIARKLGVLPANCLILEDAVSGVRAANAAEMKCIAVPEPINRGRPEYAMAERQIESLHQLNWPMIESLWSEESAA